MAKIKGLESEADKKLREGLEKRGLVKKPKGKDKKK